MRECGMTLVEIIGVVAVIAILASVLSPRLLSVLARGKVASTAQSLGGLTTLIPQYLTISNTLPTRLGYETGNDATYGGRFDADLITVGLTDQLFRPAMGKQGRQNGFGCDISSFNAGSLLQRGHIRASPGGASLLTPSEAITSSVNFDLNRDGTGDFDTTRMVAYAYLPGVNAGEAAQLNQILDSETNAPGVLDLAGRCINSAASPSNTVTVYVYLGSQ